MNLPQTESETVTVDSRPTYRYDPDATREFYRMIVGNHHHAMLGWLDKLESSGGVIAQIWPDGEVDPYACADDGLTWIAFFRSLCKHCGILDATDTPWDRLAVLRVKE